MTGSLLTQNRFAGKVALVTGSARGIGKNIIRALASQGAAVAVCDIDEENGAATTTELRKQSFTAELFLLDLSQKGSPQALVQAVVKVFGKVDILVNNVRAGRRCALMDEDEDNWDRTLAVSLKSAFFASQEVVRNMSKTGGGSIVNICSIAAVMSCNESPSY